MKLVEVSVSKIKEIPVREGVVTTGIYKEPVKGRVTLRALNLDGDEQADLSVHGGPNRAVYAYALEHYESWQRQLARDDFKVPQFGENFTVEGMIEDSVHVGDIFRVGAATVQITQPRLPCYKLALRMNDPHFPKKFAQSGRSGFYLRVLEEGEVGAGDTIELVEEDLERMTVRRVCDLYYFGSKDPEDARRALRIRSLSPGWRKEFEERL